MNLPLVERELRISARRRSTYVVRTLVPGLALLALAALLYFDGSRITPGEAAEVLAVAAFLFQAFVVVAIAPLLASGSLAQERQDQTLDLLALADFRGIDLVLSKFAAMLLQVCLLLAGVLPLYAFVTFLGGLDFRLTALQFAVLSVYAVLICSAGLYLSLCARSRREAALGIYVFILVWLLVGGGTDLFLAWYTSAGPVQPFAGPRYMARAVDPLPEFSPWLFTLRLIEGNAEPVNAIATSVPALLAAVIFLAAAIRRVRRHGRDLPARKQMVPASMRSRLLGHTSAAQGLFAGAAGYPAPPEPRSRGLLIALLMFALALVPIFGWYLLLIVLSIQALFYVRSAATEGALEDLALTPIDDRGLANLILRGYYRKAWLCIPAIPLALWSQYVALAASLDDPVFQSVAYAIQGAAATAILALYLPAVVFQLVFAVVCGLTAGIRAVSLTRQMRRVLIVQGFVLALTLLPLAALMVNLHAYFLFGRAVIDVNTQVDLVVGGLFAYDLYVFVVYMLASRYLLRDFRRATRREVAGGAPPPRRRHQRWLRPRALSPDDGEAQPRFAPWNSRSLNAN